MADQIRALYADRRFEEFAIDGMRSTIATRLVQSKQTIPHFYLTTDIGLDRLLALRDEANAVADDGAGGAAALRISVNHLVVKAYALALRRVPAANAVWAGDRIFRMASVDVGIAVAIDGGLITPVIRDADTKPLLALSSEARDLAARARGRQLAPKQYQGGTGSVSNLGAYGVREFMAIINPPQSTILAVGAVQRRPVETLEGGLRFASQITVTLSCDHRVVDGAVGAELLSALKLLMESPLRLFL
jgi:pyruvate dehydrogenase E2 component (dihydrolipoamide acetyltransferase)